MAAAVVTGAAGEFDNGSSVDHLGDNLRCFRQIAIANCSLECCILGCSC